MKLRFLVVFTFLILIVGSSHLSAARFLRAEVFRPHFEIGGIRDRSQRPGEQSHSILRVHDETKTVVSGRVYLNSEGVHFAERRISQGTNLADRIIPALYGEIAWSRIRITAFGRTIETLNNPKIWVTPKRGVQTKIELPNSFVVRIRQNSDSRTVSLLNERETIASLHRQIDNLLDAGNFDFHRTNFGRVGNQIVSGLIRIKRGEMLRRAAAAVKEKITSRELTRHVGTLVDQSLQNLTLDVGDQVTVRLQKQRHSWSVQLVDSGHELPEAVQQVIASPGPTSQNRVRLVTNSEGFSAIFPILLSRLTTERGEIRNFERLARGTLIAYTPPDETSQRRLRLAIRDTGIENIPENFRLAIYTGTNSAAYAPRFFFSRPENKLAEIRIRLRAILLDWNVRQSLTDKRHSPPIEIQLSFQVQENHQVRLAGVGYRPVQGNEERAFAKNITSWNDFGSTVRNILLIAAVNQQFRQQNVSVDRAGLRVNVVENYLVVESR